MDPDFQTVETVDPPGTVRPEAFNAGWLPIAHDHSGAYLAVDLRPDERGQVGQIINFGARERKRFVLASSITEFLRTCSRTSRMVALNTGATRGPWNYASPTRRSVTRWICANSLVPQPSDLGLQVRSPQPSPDLAYTPD
ncbi:SMI1/KNR4 family protein [Deinococcus malanensis]